MTVPGVAPHRHDRLDAMAASVLLLCCALWGFQSVAIKLATPGISPFLQAGIRSVIALAFLWAWSAWRGVRLIERDGTLAAGLFVGVLFALEFAFLYMALNFTTASRAVVFLYTAPFFTALGLHLFVPGERVRRHQVVGLVCAFAGVVAAFADALAFPDATMLLGDALALVAAAGWAATTVVVKGSRLIAISPNRTLAYQLAVSAAALPVLSFAVGEPGIVRLDAVVVGSVLYQAVVVAFASYLAWFWLMRHYPAPQLSAFTFFAPLFGVAGGAVVLGEAVGAGLIVGALFVGVGIWLVNRPARR